MNTWSVHGKCMTGAEAHLEERWEDGVEKPGWHIAARLAVWRHCGAALRGGHSGAVGSASKAALRAGGPKRP